MLRLMRKITQLQTSGFSDGSIFGDLKSHDELENGSFAGTVCPDEADFSPLSTVNETPSRMTSSAKDFFDTLP